MGDAKRVTQSLQNFEMSTGIDLGHLFPFEHLRNHHCLKITILEIF